MKLYVARHGQTEWNIQNRVCGISDVELTPEGERQAEALAEVVRGYPADLIITSPLRRAVRTGEIIAAACGLPLRTEEALIEQNYGIYEGVDRSDPAYQSGKREFAHRPPEGESILQMVHRVYRLLDGLKGECPDKNILLITHGGVCRVINSYFYDMTTESFFSYTLQNGTLKEYEL